jgi:transcriptional regulator with XRE-family HTH domain
MSSERPTTEPRHALGSAIAQARRDAGLTSSAVAERAGIESSFYEAIETARQEASLETIVLIATALDLSAAELFGRAGL